MARLKDREKALSLRKAGKSYSQIKSELGVGKGTLSIWLRDYPLSRGRMRELRDFNEKRIEKFRLTMRRKRDDRLKTFYKQQKHAILPLINKRSLYLAGILLYWGEGFKRAREAGITNTDPSIIKFFLYWLINFWKAPKEKVRIQLHLYSDMDIVKEKLFWSKTLNIPLKQFTQPYIKKASSVRTNHKGRFGHGTCVARVSDTRLAEKIQMSIKVISDKYDKIEGSRLAD